MYPRVHRETRRAILQRFPYAIYFRVAGEEIVVLAVDRDQRDSLCATPASLLRIIGEGQPTMDDTSYW